MSMLTPDMVEGREELFQALEEILNPEGTIRPYTMVKITNRGMTPFDGQKSFYENVEYPLAPGESRVVPYYAMCLWCGDPRAIDHPTDVRIRHRTDEWKRLRQFYGVYDDLTLIPSMIPHLEVTTLTGHRIYTILLL